MGERCTESGGDVFGHRVKEKACVQLSKWRWLLPPLSYRGRVLVTDNFVASALWHGFSVLTAPRSRIENIQKAIIDFL